MSKEIRNRSLCNNCDNCGVEPEAQLVCFQCFRGSNWIPIKESTDFLHKRKDKGYK